MEIPRMNVDCPICGESLHVENNKWRCGNIYCRAYELQHSAYGRQVA